MNKTEQAQQLRLAAELIETGHPWERYSNGAREWIKSELSPAMAVTHGDKIRPILATPPDGRPLHNPDNLTADQVGLGHRLCLVGETLPEGYEFWQRDEWDKGHFLGKHVPEYERESPCRVPLSVPWPEVTPEPPPFQLPPSPPGIEWHRKDGWKEGDLPQGYRPLTDGELIQAGDGVRNKKHLNGFRFVKAACSVGHKAGETFPDQFGRTTRPLVFQHEGKEWTYHRPGDPMPCDEWLKIEILYETAPDDDKPEYTAANRQRADDVNWRQGTTVIGWRYAETTKQVELGPEDIVTKLKEAIAMLETLTKTKA